MNARDMSLQDIITDVLDKIPQKIYEVLSSGWGIALSCLVFVGTFLGDRLPLLAYIGIAVLIDGIWGVITSTRAKRFIFSKMLAKTAIKIAAYVSTYGLVALIEKGFTDGEFILTSSSIAAILIASELWSVLGHIGIAYPDFLPVKLLKKYLKGEMSKKLGIPEEELDEMLRTRKSEYFENKVRKDEKNSTHS